MSLPFSVALWKLSNGRCIDSCDVGWCLRGELAESLLFWQPGASLNPALFVDPQISREDHLTPAFAGRQESRAAPGSQPTKRICLGIRSRWPTMPWPSRW